MKTSKLQAYIAIIEMLQKKGPMELTQISKITLIDNKSLGEHVEFLLSQKVLDKQDYLGSQVYDLAPLAFKILKFFGKEISVE